MSFKKGHYQNKAQLETMIATASGKNPADLVIKNASFLDVFNGCFTKGDVAVKDGFIIGTIESYEGLTEIDGTGCFIVPGFIDAHLHIESSLMIPDQFQRAVLPYGTTTVVWDPHEITNVKGLEGIQWALKSTENLLLDIFVMLPSCVPSTPPALGLETSGAVIYPHDLTIFKNRKNVLGLAEMMNYPGVINNDSDTLEKIDAFSDVHCDGHAPELSGKALNAYITAGIETDHESTKLSEAQEKLSKGLYCLIREGSCAKDADALLPLLNEYTSTVLALCSDDRNPVDIFNEGHINAIINKALKMGHRPETIFRVASFSAARLFGINDRGAIAPGHKADLCLVKPINNDWKQGMKIHSVYKSGQMISPEVFKQNPEYGFNGKNIHLETCQLIDFHLPAKTALTQKVRIIGIRPGQLITDSLSAELPVVNNEIENDLKQDILKIAVFERHKGTGRHSVGFVKGFGLKKGAIATSINHDSHNIIVVGASDEAMVQAVRKIIEIDGGIVVTDGENTWETLTLSVGGLMSNQPAQSIFDELTALKKLAHQIGCVLEEPFLQLSFLALPVIPSLKITDQGLVDVEHFKKVDVCLDS